MGAHGAFFARRDPGFYRTGLKNKERKYREPHMDHQWHCACLPGHSSFDGASVKKRSPKDTFVFQVSPRLGHTRQLKGNKCLAPYLLGFSNSFLCQRLLHKGFTEFHKVILILILFVVLRAFSVYLCVKNILT